MRKIVLAVVAALVVLLAGISQVNAAQPPGITLSPNQMSGCGQAVLYDASTSGDTRLVVGTSNTRIYVCGYVFFSNGSATVKLEYGTGGTCGSGTTAVTPGFIFTAQTGIVDHLPVYTGLPPVPASNDLCINVNAGVAVQGIVYFTQF